MRIVRLSTLAGLTAAIVSGAVLFGISQKVQDAEDRLADVRAVASQDTQALRVLHAEWDYLNRPDRLEKLASQYLGMQAPSVIAISSDPATLPNAFDPPEPSRKPTLLAGAVEPAGWGPAGPVIAMAIPTVPAAVAAPVLRPAPVPSQHALFSPQSYAKVEDAAFHRMIGGIAGAGATNYAENSR